VLNKVSFSVAKNQKVALMGSSGSGKSTVIALLERFYDPLSGSITFDGHDLRTLNLRDLRSKLSLVGQVTEKHTRNNIHKHAYAGTLNGFTHRRVLLVLTDPGA
jgi:ABC-type bacteriocin/lantibiotic exporter with double-glycine peptidase domain